MFASFVSKIKNWGSKMSAALVSVTGSVYVEEQGGLDSEVLTRYKDAKTEKAESWLTEWADAQLRGEDIVNGYSSKSNLSLVTDQGFRVGGQESMPLIKGRMGQDLVVAVERVLSANMSPRQRDACVYIFEPGNIDWRERMEKAGYKKTRYAELKVTAVTLVKRLL